MTRSTLVRAALLAVTLAPAAALADRPTEEVAFYYNKIAFQYASTTDTRAAPPMLTPIDLLPNAGQAAGRDMVMKGSNILLNAAPAASSSKPKEIVVVGSKLPASDASRRAHPDFAWLPPARPAAGSAPAPASIAAPKPPPQPYTLIEMLPVRGRR